MVITIANHRAQKQVKGIDPRDREAVEKAVREVGSRDKVTPATFAHYVRVIVNGAPKAAEDGEYSVSMVFADAVNALDIDFHTS